MKKRFAICGMIFMFLFFGCQKKSKLEGRWTSAFTGAIYEFSGKTFTLSTVVLNSSVMVRGSFQISKNKLSTTALELSYDFGETWTKNDGSLIPVEKNEAPMIFISNQKIQLADSEYVRF